MDHQCLMAAILHDVIEDTETAKEQLAEQFGPELAELVDGVTKLGKFSTLSHEQQQAENIRKMFLAMAEDIRDLVKNRADEPVPEIAELLLIFAAIGFITALLSKLCHQASISIQTSCQHNVLQGLWFFILAP